ncbi:MAG TPA: sugar phosphate nucleotidyltransferase, partial [bacterium]|nr:sugar phosphate nucleotidyltransferase [bacterium]
MYALIPAGGSGSRLWPLSRSSFPKHLLDLSGQGSMIQETVQRVSPLIAADETIVLTAHNHAAAIIEQLPG